MIHSPACVIGVFALFFFQDIVNVGLLKAGLDDWIVPFSALKEVIVGVLVFGFVVAYVPRLRFQLGRAILLLVFTIAVTVGIWRGIEKYPLEGVLFELRTLL